METLSSHRLGWPSCYAFSREDLSCDSIKAPAMQPKFASCLKLPSLQSDIHCRCRTRLKYWWDGSWLGKTGLRQWNKAVWHMSWVQIWNIYWGLHSLFQWRVYIKFVLVELLMKGMTGGTANPHLVINVDWIQPHVSSDMGLAAMKQTLSHQIASSPVCVDVRQKASDCLIRGV